MHAHGFPGTTIGCLLSVRLVLKQLVLNFGYFLVMYLFVFGTRNDRLGPQSQVLSC